MRYVDADEIIRKQRDLIRRTCDEVYANDWQHPLILAMASMYGIVVDAPTIEPVKHGKWINGDCSECGFPIPTDDRIDYIAEADVHYCYNCGAKMDGEVNETD